MTLTIEQLPKDVDVALRKKAESEGRSVQEVAVEVLARGLGVRDERSATIATAPEKMRDLSDIVGTWVDDPEFDLAMKEFERINPEMWK